jgi:hypothetical protein
MTQPPADRQEATPGKDPWTSRTIISGRKTTPATGLMVNFSSPTA